MNELAPIGPTAGTGLALVQPGIESSIPLDTRENKVKVFRALQGQDFPADEMIGEVIDLADAVIHKVQLPDQKTGELRACQRTVLISADGSRIGSVSEGLVNSLRALTILFGPLPWKPAQKVCIREQKSRGGLKYYLLEPVE